MQEGKKPKFRKLAEGEDLVTQGDTGEELFLLLDGVLTVLVDGEEVAEVGPGSILGERAGIEGGVRTSTLRAMTPVRVAIAHLSDLQPDVLEDLSTHHRREDAVTAAQDG
jgi:CRP-like cAMP-binding protein